MEEFTLHNNIHDPPDIMLLLQVDSAAADKEGLVAGVDTDQAAGEAAGDEPQ